MRFYGYLYLKYHRFLIDSATYVSVYFSYLTCRSSPETQGSADFYSSSDMLERGILTMNGSRTLRQPSPPSEDMSEGSDVLSNPSYDIITEDVSRFTTQYYTTVEPQGSPQMAEHLTPKDHSSSSGSSSSGGSKSTSTSSDEGQGVALLHQSSPSMRKRTATPDIPSGAPSPVRSMCATLPTSTASSNDSSSVKHWSYEEQFKQVCVLHRVLCITYVHVTSRYSIVYAVEWSLQ